MYFIALATLMIAIGVSSTARAASAANTQSPLGLNLNGVSYYTAEQPFLDIFKTTGVSKSLPGWTTSSAATFDTGEEAYLQLDAYGYPTTLTASASDPHSPQLFGWVVLFMVFNLPNSNAGTGLPYRPGQYVVLYDGQGTMNYGSDAQLVKASAGRDVINVATPTVGGGISIAIHATDPNHTGNYIRNIRVVKAEEESLLKAGNVFRPGFLSLIQNFHVLRFMDWLDINGSTLTSWGGRPQISDGGWGSNNGTPIEVAVQLCNAVGADCWLNVPHQADSNYITQMAALVHSMLGANQKAYVEFSNEVWNGAFPQYVYAVNQGKAMWPSAGATEFDYNRSWYGMRVAQMCDAWKATWGADSARVVCVLGAQAASTYSATQSLKCPLWTGSGNAPCSNHNINAVAIAPYFGNFQAQTSWTSDSDGGLSKLFQELNQGGLISGDYPGGDLKQTSSWEAAYKAALASYNLPFIAYEGGQTFLGFPQYLNGTSFVNLYIAANRDPRMGAAYTTALNNWKTNGGGTYVIFQDIYTPTQYGEWGALESFLDTVSPLSSAPPKWQAIQNFISGNTCWWSGCAGTVGTTLGKPMAPTLTVH
ncbi:MAG: cellulose-binding protein [Pseudomonadota bacterium]|nr:cellulose-binding protein [Pseudomonadota bacterium]